MNGLPRSQRMFVGAAAAVLLVAGMWFYRFERRQQRESAERTLLAIAQLKTDQVTAWREGQLGEAMELMMSPVFVRTVGAWLKDAAPERVAEFRTRLAALRERYHYLDVVLTDPEGRIRLRLEGACGTLSADALRGTAQALRERRPILTDLHAGEDGKGVHLGVIAPLIGEGGQPVGAIILQIDASRVLFPLLRAWPLPSVTAEALLVRRDGDAALFLSSVRHQTNTALSLRIPLTRKEVPAVMAVWGREGVVDGTDYRGAHVLSVLRPVPNSNWHLVAKIDEAEALSPWRLQALLIVGCLVGLGLAAAAAVGALWQRRGKEHYLTLFQSEAARRKSDERYRTTLMSVGDGVIATDREGRVELMNPVAESLSGWKEDEARGRPIEEVFRIVNEHTRLPVENPMRRVLREGVIVGMANHTVLIARDGAERAIADSGAPISGPAGGLTGVVLVFRDVSAAQRQLREREATLELLRLLNEPGSLQALVRNVTAFFQDYAKCSAVGIRLRDGEDYPYFETRGFPAEFVTAENSLCALDDGSRLLRDSKGYPILECMCGNVLCHRFDPQQPFFSARGSFCSNGTTELLATSSAEDRQARTRNRCNGEGYESVALIRLQSGDDTLGLLQLNDRAKGRFTPELLAFLEHAADQLAIALAQRKSELRFRSTVDNMMEGCQIIGYDWRYLYANPALALQCRRSIDELVGHTMAEVYPGIEATPLFAVLRRCMSERRSEQLENEFEFADGSRAWFDLQIQPVPEGLFVMSLDITARRQAENERQRLVSAIEQAAEVIVVTDASGTIQYANPAFEAVTGYTRQEAIGRNPRLLKSGEQDEAFYRKLWATITGGKTWVGQFTNRRKNGERYTEEASISPVRDASGAIVSYVAVKRDITETLRLRDDNVRLEDQLRQSQRMEAVGRLAGGVAHDFNNILQVILSNIGLALEEAGPDSPLRDSLLQIMGAAERSASLTRQLLAFARKQTVSPKVVDLNESLSGVLKMIRRLIGENIELAFVPGAGLGRVRIDPTQLDQILANLVVNARDAITDAGTVTIATQRLVADAAFCAAHPEVLPGEYAMLVVRDTGCGMNPETRDHVFEPFFTRKEAGQGMGLGLATVYGIVKQNEGFVTVESEPGHGSVFRIGLPRVEVPGSALPAGEAGSRPPLGTETVLLVEDEAAILKQGERMLRRLGYTVLAAASAAEAIRLATEHDGRIHLLITDVIMPKMNGRELSERLARVRPDMQCLYMSGYTANVIAQHSVLDDGVNFIAKPFLLADLACRIREILDRT